MNDIVHVMFVSKILDYNVVFYTSSSMTNDKSSLKIVLFEIVLREDFYIASHIGEICGQGYTGMIAIVSGFVWKRMRLLDSIKQFGKRDGLNIYHKVKQII